MKLTQSAFIFSHVLKNDLPIRSGLARQVQHVSDFDQLTTNQQMSIELLPLVLVISLSIVLTYHLLAQLLDRKIATIASFLLALDPFHISISCFGVVRHQGDGVGITAATATSEPSCQCGMLGAIFACQICQSEILSAFPLWVIFDKLFYINHLNGLAPHLITWSV